MGDIQKAQPHQERPARADLHPFTSRRPTTDTLWDPDERPDCKQELEMENEMKLSFGKRQGKGAPRVMAVWECEDGGGTPIGKVVLAGDTRPSCMWEWHHLDSAGGRENL